MPLVRVFYPARGFSLANQMKRVTVVMPVELHKTLKLLSFSKDTTMNDLILAAVQEYISENGYQVNKIEQN